MDDEDETTREKYWESSNSAEMAGDILVEPETLGKYSKLGVERDADAVEEENVRKHGAEAGVNKAGENRLLSNQQYIYIKFIHPFSSFLFSYLPISSILNWYFLRKSSRSFNKEELAPSLTLLTLLRYFVYK